MMFKKEKTNILQQSVEKLSSMLEESNYLEWAYLFRK